MGTDKYFLAVHQNLDIFKGHYYAGCGYYNFTQLFRNLAQKITGKIDADLNWDSFNEEWSKHARYTTKDYALIILFNADGLDKRINDLTKLLTALCQE